VSVAGADAQRRSKADRAVAERMREAADRVFKPLLQQQLERARAAEERAAVLQTAVERIALGHVDDLAGEARRVLDELGIVPDVATADNDATLDTA
jgi:hypothetical protein